MASVNATSNHSQFASHVAGSPTAANVRPPLVFLFSGHGAQTYQMGREIYEAVDDFRDLMDRLNGAISAKLGVSVLEEIYSGSRRHAEPLESFANAHCGIFMVELSLALTLIRRVGIPMRLVGSSLGELTASVVAGALSCEQAIELLVHHITVLREKSRRGFMVAVIGALDVYRGDPELSLSCDVASVADDHFVIAGYLEELERVHVLLDRKGIAYQDLPVSYPFHTSRIDGIQKDMLDCRAWPTRPPAIPVLSCATGGFAQGYNKEHMWSSIREPLQTAQVLSRLEREGPWTYIDLGPGATMASALRRRGTCSTSTVHHLLAPFGKELAAFLELTAFCSSEEQ